MILSQKIFSLIINENNIIFFDMSELFIQYLALQSTYHTFVLFVTH